MRSIRGVAAAIASSAPRENPSLDPVHQIEWHTQNIPVPVEQDRPGNRNADRVKRRKDTVFAIDGMRATQDRPVGLLAQHHIPVSIGYEICPIGLPSGNLLQLH